MSYDTNWKEIFENIEQNSTNKVVKILNERGVFTDEDIPYVSRGAYERGTEFFKLHLMNNGYDGGELETTAKYLPTHGAVYAIFDTTRWAHREVQKYLEKYGQQERI